MVGMTIYTTALLSIIVVPVSFFIFDSAAGPEIGFILVSICIVLLAAFPLIFLFLPKIIGVYTKNAEAVQRVDEDSIQTTTITRSKDGKMKAHSSHGNSHVDHSARPAGAGSGRSKLEVKISDGDRVSRMDTDRAVLGCKLDIEDSASVNSGYENRANPNSGLLALCRRTTELMQTLRRDVSDSANHNSPSGSRVNSAPMRFRSSKFGPGKIQSNPNSPRLTALRANSLNYSVSPTPASNIAASSVTVVGDASELASATATFTEPVVN